MIFNPSLDHKKQTPVVFWINETSVGQSVSQIHFCLFEACKSCKMSFKSLQSTKERKTMFQELFFSLKIQFNLRFCNMSGRDQNIRQNLTYPYLIAAPNREKN